MYIMKIDKLFMSSSFDISKDLFQYNDGWDNLVYYLLHQKSLIDKENLIEITQIKEKFGKLRIYISYLEYKCLYNKIIKYIPKKLFYLLFRHYPNKKYNPLYIQIYRLTQYIETISGYICEDCGNIGELVNIDGYYQTLCNNCNILKKQEIDNENENLICSGHLQSTDI